MAAVSFWYSAARFLGLNAPDPIIRPLTQGLPAPLPTLAGAEKNDEHTMTDSGRQAFPDVPQFDVATQVDAPHVNLNTQVYDVRI